MTLNKKRIAAVLIIAIVAAAALSGIGVGIYFAAQNEKFEGFVYVNGVDGEKTPLANVSVTNGRDVVKTDGNGRYVLDGWLKERFVTITIPSGYWTEKYYVDTKKKDVNNKEINFYLDKKEIDESEHTFLQVSDSEIGESGVGEWIDHTKAVVDELKPAFLIHTGDICYEDGLKQHIKGMNTENMGVPVRYVIGNHDYVKYGSYSEQLFEDTYGPVCYSFDVGDIHYIVTPFMTGADYMPRYMPNNVWKWVANDIANMDKSKKIVMFNHTFCSDENGFTVKYGGKTLDFKKEGLIAWIFGHWHYNYMYEVNGVFNISTGRPDGGGIDSTPAAVRSVDMKGTELARSDMHYYDFRSAAPEEGLLQKVGGHVEFAEPIVSGDTVYVATVDDGWPKECGIYALDARNKTVKWQYRTDNSIRNSFALTADNKLVAQDVTGQVYCIDANDGKLIWKKDTELSFATNTGFNALVEGDSVYCGGAQKSVCLSLRDGSLKWSVENSGANSSAARMILIEDKLIVSSQWDEIIAYDKNTGKRVWSENKDSIRYRSSSPTYINGKMYVVSDGRLFTFDPKNGKYTFVFAAPKGKDDKGNVIERNLNTTASVYIDGNTAVIPTVTDGVIAVDINSGELKWQVKTGKSLVYTSPYSTGDVSSVESSIVERDGRLYFGASDGYVYSVNKDGSGVKKVNIGSPILCSVAFFEDNVVTADFSGNITLTPISKLA